MRRRLLGGTCVPVESWVAATLLTTNPAVCMLLGKGFQKAFTYLPGACLTQSSVFGG